MTVVIPFAGDVRDTRLLYEHFGNLELRSGDKIVLVDNSGGGLPEQPPDNWQTVRAEDEYTSYFARNAGLPSVRTDWVLFIDSDCRPTDTLLDDYFLTDRAQTVGAIGGRINGAAAGSFAESLATAQGSLDQSSFLSRGPAAFAATANALVRVSALAEAGGFVNGIRSGGDADLGRRLKLLGWDLEYEARAAVTHQHRQNLRSLLRQRRNYGAGDAWIHRRYSLRAPVRSLVVQLCKPPLLALRHLSRGQFRAASLSIAAEATVLAFVVGFISHNRPTQGSGADMRAKDTKGVAVADSIDLSCLPGVMEVGYRCIPVNAGPPSGQHLRYAEDDGHFERLVAAVRVGLRAPRRSGRVVRRHGFAGLLTAAAPALRVRARGVDVEVDAANDAFAWSVVTLAGR